jgi:hypothetical protein
MTSGSDAPEAIDQRLAEARDSVLATNERVMAQQEGDPGQAIVLTDLRLLAIKVGIAATGQADGQIIGDFPLGKVTAVNVRKGPLGAVIQIVAADQEPPKPGEAPSNVIVFTGDTRVKKCEQMAATIQSVLGKELGRVEAQPRGPQSESEPQSTQPEQQAETVEEQPVRRGREARSLADEIFAEVVSGEAANEMPAASVAPPSEQVAPEPVPAAPLAMPEEVAAAEPEPDAAEYLPNPNLPKPARRGSGPAQRLLVLLGLLMVAVVVCVSVTAPLRHQDKAPLARVDVNHLTGGSKAAQAQLQEVSSYYASATQCLAPCRKAATALAAAVESGDTNRMKSALCEGVANRCWQELNRMTAPVEMAKEQESIISGVMMVRTAVTSVSGGLQSSASIDSAKVLDDIKEGLNRIDKGLSMIAQTKATLRSQARQQADH